MSELQDTAIRAERAFLVGVQTDKIPKSEAESLLAELGGLASTLGLEEAGRILVRVRERTAALLLGTGKADEIVAAAKAEGADSILFDHQLTPTQQRNWEELSGLKAYDRNELIIRIFASRARTKEAALQVELAQLEYSMPRLAHSYADLSRQRGGRYGTKGSGEQKIELDRREIEHRIHEIKDELKDVRMSRDVQRARREKASVPRAAIVGYTNAGKSSLLNALAAASVLAQDKLFATLDPTTRRMSLSREAPSSSPTPWASCETCPTTSSRPSRRPSRRRPRPISSSRWSTPPTPRPSPHGRDGQGPARDRRRRRPSRPRPQQDRPRDGQAFLDGWRTDAPAASCLRKTGPECASFPRPVEDRLTRRFGRGQAPRSRRRVRDGRLASPRGLDPRGRTRGGRDRAARAPAREARVEVREVIGAR